jgi:hypothetical protein
MIKFIFKLKIFYTILIFKVMKVLEKPPFNQAVSPANPFINFCNHLVHGVYGGIDEASSYLYEKGAHAVTLKGVK